MRVARERTRFKARCDRTPRLKCPSVMRPVVSVSKYIAADHALVTHQGWTHPPVAYLRPVTPLGTRFNYRTPCRGAPLDLNV